MTRGGPNGRQRFLEFDQAYGNSKTFGSGEADLLSLSDEDLLRIVRGCDAVVSCLGHVLSFKGIFGPPRDLVTQATRRLCRAIVAAHPTMPVKFILMSSVSVNQPAGRDAHRGAFEKGVM